MATAADAMSAAVPVTPMSGSRLWIDGMVRCVFTGHSDHHPRQDGGQDIDAGVSEPDEKGNWIAVLTENNA
jgi:hypothetical protein